MLFGFSINYSTYLAAETNHTLKKNLEQTLIGTANGDNQGQAVPIGTEIQGTVDLLARARLRSDPLRGAKQAAVEKLVAALSNLPAYTQQCNTFSNFNESPF